MALESALMSFRGPDGTGFTRLRNGEEPERGEPGSYALVVEPQRRLPSPRVGSRRRHLRPAGMSLRLGARQPSWPDRPPSPRRQAPALARRLPSGARRGRRRSGSRGHPRGWSAGSPATLPPIPRHPSRSLGWDPLTAAVRATSCAGPTLLAPGDYLSPTSPGPSLSGNVGLSVTYLCDSRHRRRRRLGVGSV